MVFELPSLFFSFHSSSYMCLVWCYLDLEIFLLLCSLCFVNFILFFVLLYSEFWIILYFMFYTLFSSSMISFFFYLLLVFFFFCCLLSYFIFLIYFGSSLMLSIDLFYLFLYRFLLPRPRSLPLSSFKLTFLSLLVYSKAFL